MTNCFYTKISRSIKFLGAFGMFFFCALTVNAQILTAEPDLTDPHVNPDTNAYGGNFRPEMLYQPVSAPVLGSVNIIRYEGAVTAVVEFKSVGNNGVFNLVKKSANGNTEGSVLAYPSEGRLLINNLQDNSFYDVYGVDSKGTPVVVANINTAPLKRGEDPIAVSDELYRALSTYVANDKGDGRTQRLDDYIKALPNVSPYEKVSFLQRYLLRGKAIPNTYIGKDPFPFIREVIDGSDEDENFTDENRCNCEFVINQSAIAIPDAVPFNNSVDDSYSSDGNAFGDASRWWMNTRAEGPAKYHLLASDGWKDGNTVYTMRYDFAANGPSSNKMPYFARLSYHLLCVNMPNIVPEKCGCSKTAKVDFSYKTKVSAKATIRNSWWDRRSFASAQDYSVALITKEKVNSLNDVQVLDAGLISAQSKCSGGVSPLIISDGLQIVWGVIKTVKSAKTGNFSETSDQVDNLITKINSVLEKVFKEQECEQAISEGTPLLGGTTLAIEPNDPVSVILLSGSSMVTGGKRSWDSKAEVTSNFHLAGVLLGSNPDPITSHCCTDYAAQWVWAGQPDYESNLQILVSDFIFRNIPNNVPLTINGVPATPGQVRVPTEIGNATAEFMGCEKKVPIYNPR